MKQVFVQTDMEETTPLSYDYDLDEGYLFTTLKHSSSGNWADHLIGSIAGSIQDTGDELIIKINDMKPLKLDYIQAQQVLILLLNYNQEKIEIRESKLIKSI